MRRLLTLVFLCLFLSTSRVDAQLILGHIDIPNPGQHIPYGGLYLDGWEFECASGDVGYLSALSIDLLDLNTGQWWSPGGNLHGWHDLWRPDVWEVYNQYCDMVTWQGLPLKTGYQWFLDAQPSPGHYVVVVTWIHSGAPATINQVEVWIDPPPPGLSGSGRVAAVREHWARRRRRQDTAAVP